MKDETLLLDLRQRMSPHSTNNKVSLRSDPLPRSLCQLQSQHAPVFKSRSATPVPPINPRTNPKYSACSSAIILGFRVQAKPTFQGGSALCASPACDRFHSQQQQSCLRQERRPGRRRMRSWMSLWWRPSTSRRPWRSPRRCTGRISRTNSCSELPPPPTR
jgi:hypothetical protein